jgi:hypothetical protein
MGKRSTFARRPQDSYATPREAVVPLLPHLPKMFTYVEPCAGDGDLVGHLPGKCVRSFDVEVDALSNWRTMADLIITNPPWDRNILHPMITHFVERADTWLLIDADWMHTRQSSDYMRLCRKVVSIGRIKWIPDSKMTGKDNCCWYLFSRGRGRTVFVGR